VFTYDGESGEWLAGAQVVGAQPEQGIAADPDSGRVYVTNAGSDSVTVIQDCPS
jgi:DNA-binding beta-propeller fold protein YncE